LRHLPDIKRLGGSPPKDQEATQQETGLFGIKESRREIATLELDLEKTENELRLRTEKERRLRSAIEDIIEAGQEQRRRIDEARSRLVAEQEHNILHDMVALRKVSDEQQESNEAAVALRQSDTPEELTVAELAHAKAEKQPHETNNAVRHLTEQSKQGITELETLLETAESESSDNAKREEELSRRLERLRSRIEEQRRSIERKEAEGGDAVQQIRANEQTQRLGDLKKFHQESQKKIARSEPHYHHLPQSEWLRLRETQRRPKEEDRRSELQLGRAKMEERLCLRTEARELAVGEVQSLQSFVEERLRLERSIQNLREQEQRLRAELERIRERQSRFDVAEELRCFEELVLIRAHAEEEEAFLAELMRTADLQAGEQGLSLPSMITSVLRPIDLERTSPDLT